MTDNGITEVWRALSLNRTFTRGRFALRCCIRQPIEQFSVYCRLPFTIDRGAGLSVNQCAMFIRFRDLWTSSVRIRWKVDCDESSVVLRTHQRAQVLLKRAQPIFSKADRGMSGSSFADCGLLHGFVLTGGALTVESC